MVFEYGMRQVEYLKSKDKRLGEAMDVIGHIEREIEPDLFTSLVQCVVGQQISTAAQRTICQRMRDAYGQITPEAIGGATVEELQAHGISFRKAGYISDFTKKINSGEFDLDALYNKSDDEVIAELSAMKGIGVWTAEMIMTFCMQRPDILSYGDLAIHRGMRMLYHHRNVDRKLFDKYRRRFSPCGSVASLYLWAIAGSAIPGMKDNAPKKARVKIINQEANIMDYTYCLNSPIGALTIASDGESITGLWMESQKYYGSTLGSQQQQSRLPVFELVEQWLNSYFEGGQPDVDLPLAPLGSDFRKAVWAALMDIPYGQTTTYGAIAERLNQQGRRTSARAVGGAVGHNPISIIIPCHRVIGADGSLTGYAGGVEKKIWLLELENALPDNAKKQA